MSRIHFNLGSELSLDSIMAFLGLQTALVVLVLADLVSPINSRVFGFVCLGLLLMTAYLTWRQTEQGNHPIFLLMVFLALFQFGRMFSWFISGEWNIAWFDLATARPFTVEERGLKQAMLMVPLSASFVYLGFFAKKGRNVLTFTKNDQMRAFFGWLYFLTIGFVVIKDVSYLRYTLEHGGYMATYLGGGEHVEQVGLPIRALALLNTMAFLPYLILENRKRLILIAMGSYLAVLVLELLVGLRGKFFINFMFLWMVYNIKTGSSFKPITAGAVGSGLIFAAIGAEIFRQSRSSSLDVNLVEYFLDSQGVSFFVTVASVIYHDVFERHSIEYLLNQFLVPFIHVAKFGEGALLTLDLTSFLNPMAAKLGFGTGDAYLANLYLLGGYLAVALGSLLIGSFSAWITRAPESPFWRTISLSILMWIPYLPRSGYLEPIATSIKYFLVAAFGFALYALFAWLKSCLDGSVSRNVSNG